MILIFDNYDSFTYNLVQYVGEINPDIKVIRNDAYSPEEILAMEPEAIIISPGPGYPKDAGVLEDLVVKSEGRVKILGVCLGHQGICEAFGGNITKAKYLMHGKQSKIEINNESPLFKGLPGEINVARYHSLIADDENLPDSLEPIGTDMKHHEIMAVQHKKYPIYGVQFHPESIMTSEGKTIIRNFLNISL